MPAVRAWAPQVPGIVEVFHAQFADHAYPEHAHDTWTLLVVDEGAIRSAVTLLPPHVAHTGRAATPQGFRKRVLYVDTEVLGEALTAAAVGMPSWMTACSAPGSTSSTARSSTRATSWRARAGWR